MSNKKLDRALRRSNKKKEDKVIMLSGQLGIPLSGQKLVEVPNRQGFVFVRLKNNTSELIQAYNNAVSPIYDLPVLVARQTNGYRVIGRNIDRYTNQWGQAPYLPKHGAQHSFNPSLNIGGDIVWVYSQQFMPLLGYPSGSAGSPRLAISPYIIQDLNGNWKYVGGTGSPDTTPYNPTTGSRSIMGLLYIDTASGNPAWLINSGTYFDSSLTGSNDITQYIPRPTDASQLPISAVRLVSGTSILTWDNVYDVRPFLRVIPTGTVSSGGGGGVGSIGIMGWDEGVPLGTGTVLNFVGAGVTATISGTVINVNVPNATGTVGGGNITYVVAASNASAKSKSVANYQCDGTADEQEVISALNALPSGGGKIVFSEGTFNFVHSYSSSVAIGFSGSFVTFEGQGANTVINVTEDIFAFGLLGGIADDWYYPNAQARVVFDGISFTASTPRTGGAIQAIGAVSNLVIQNNYFRNLSKGIQFQKHSHACNIINNYSEGNRSFIFVVDSTAKCHDFNVSSNKEVGMEVAGKDGTPVYFINQTDGEMFQWRIEGNSIEHIYDNTTGSVAFRLKGSVNADVVIIGNSIEETDYGIIYIGNFTSSGQILSNPLVSNNSFRDLKNAVQIEGVANGKISDNLFINFVANTSYQAVIANNYTNGTMYVQWNYMTGYSAGRMFVTQGTTGGILYTAEGDGFGVIGLDEGIFLGTGSYLNFVGAGVTATISGAIINVNIPGSNPSPTQGVVVQNNGNYFASGTVISFDNNLYLGLSGTIIHVSSPVSTYQRMEQPISLQGGTGTLFQVPDMVYASGSLGVFYNGVLQLKGSGYEELLYVSGTYQLLFSPATGSFHMVSYGVPCISQQYIGATGTNTMTDSFGVLLADSNGNQIVDSNG